MKTHQTDLKIPMAWALFSTFLSASAFNPRAARSTASMSLSPSSTDIRIRLVEPTDLTQLAELTTSALFGDADLFKDGPLVMAQRQQQLQKNRKALERRLAYEGTDSECRFFVAVEQTPFGDRICGSTDLAVRVFNASELRFDLALSDVPEGDGACRWSPYVASVAVNAADRRCGIGGRLVQAAEGWATAAGYEEIMLQVSVLNEAAISMYEQAGYSILSSFAPGEGGGGAEHVVRKGGRWETQQTGKHVMRKGLG